MRTIHAGVLESEEDIWYSCDDWLVPHIIKYTKKNPYKADFTQ